MKKKLVILLIFLCGTAFASQFTIARLKYKGGGDWYNNPSVLPNMLKFLQQNTNINPSLENGTVSLTDEELFSYPVLYMTGHGRVSFSEQEVERLRIYLENGGFLYVDDDYGIDEHIRREMAKVFPDKNFLEIPYDHDIFHNHYDFPNGLPKTHEHDGGPPKAFGLFHNNRMVVFYSFNTNISDGWADQKVHGDPEHKRQEAFKMGTNIIVYALTH